MEKTMYKPNHPIEYMRFKVFVKSLSRQFKKAPKLERNPIQFRVNKWPSGFFRLVVEAH